jgi:hypothetical protein
MMSDHQNQPAAAISARDYFRGDQRAGVSAPNLAKPCSFADHIVHARGKRTAYTSVSLDIGSIERFGEVNYQLLRQLAEEDLHVVVEHEHLLSSLIRSAREGEKADRAKAVIALRYAKNRKEGLVDWKFDITTVAPKDVINWAQRKIQMYFRIV